MDYSVKQIISGSIGGSYLRTLSGGFHNGEYYVVSVFVCIVQFAFDVSRFGLHTFVRSMSKPKAVSLLFLMD
jgi:hypothetical protein